MRELVELTRNEMFQASAAGCHRQVYSRGKTTNRHAPKGGWVTDIHGAGAEMAVAKFLNVFWSPGEPKAPDMWITGKNGERCLIQVRATDHENGHLVIQDDDDPEHFYVLVVWSSDSSFTYSIRGGVIGRKVKTDAFRSAKLDAKGKSNTKAFWIGQEWLRPFQPSRGWVQPAENGHF
jgi:hypothetical protein